MYKIILLLRAEKQLRKIKDSRLVQAFRRCLNEVAAQPRQKSKVGDLRGVYGHGFNYAGAAWIVAYFTDEEKQAVYIIAVGSHKGFWQEIKRPLN